MTRRAHRILPVVTFCLMAIWLLSPQANAKPQPLMKLAHAHLTKAGEHNTKGDAVKTKEHLDKALKTLNLASWDKDGHRMKAIGLVKKALAESDPTLIGELIEKAKEEVQTGVEHSNEKPSHNPQPLMKLALHQLNKAKISHVRHKPQLVRQCLRQALEILKKATWDKGGHGLKAAHFIKRALDTKIPKQIRKLIIKATHEVKKGIAFSVSS